MRLQVIADTTKPYITIDELKKILDNSKEANLLEKFDPWMLGLIILFTLGALILSLWMVYWYVNRIKTDELRRAVLVEALYKSKFLEIKTERNVNEPEYWKNPEYFEQQRREREQQKEEIQIYLDQINNKGKELSEEDKENSKYYNGELILIENDLTKRLSNKIIEDSRKEWERINGLYKEKIKEIETLAKESANKLIPPTTTVAGMNITGTFFIELTAILTIIFGIIILGLIGVLESAEIAPILAAIAGYVLGKTTTGWAPYGNKNTEQQIGNTTAQK